MTQQRKKKHSKSFLHLFYDPKIVEEKKYRHLKHQIGEKFQSLPFSKETSSVDYFSYFLESEKNQPILNSLKTRLISCHSSYPFKQKIKSGIIHENKRSVSVPLKSNLSGKPQSHLPVSSLKMSGNLQNSSESNAFSLEAFVPKLHTFQKKPIKGRKRKIAAGSPTNQKFITKRILSFLYGKLPRSTFKRFQKGLERSSRKLSMIKPDQGMFLAKILERRLDIVVSKMFFFDTLRNAQQFIQHKGISVNNKPVNLCTYLLKPGDIISVTNSNAFANRNPFFQNIAFFPICVKAGIQLKNWDLSIFVEKARSLFFKYPHFEVNYKLLTGVFLYSPRFLYLPLNIKKFNN